MRKLILISGRKRTGKGSLYTYVEKTTPSVGEFFFAKPIKDFCINTLGCTHEQMYGTSEQRESLTEFRWSNISKVIRDRFKNLTSEYLTARQLIQIVGTDIVRMNLDPDVWARAGARDAVRSPFNVCLMTDVRMPNELTSSGYVADKNGFSPPINIRIYRETGFVDEHSTESALDEFDAVPDQRNISQGIPGGFSMINPRLYWNSSKTQPSNPFHYLLDNNGTVEEAEANMSLILTYSGV